MTVFADVYNKTAIPLTTAPSLKNDLEVKNTVDINAGSAINAIRNVNIKAESGTEVITESANNSVNIDGTINAGIHNSLKMTISGGKLSANESENINPTVDVTEGADIFDPSTINFNATATMTNPFPADYNKALSDLQAYTPGSAEYNSLSNQVTGMEKVMATYGFAEKISGTDQYIVYDKIQIPAMELPKIELAGGKVYVNDVTTTASGNLKVNTQSNYTPAITVNNTGGLQNVGSDPMYKYTFGSQKFADWLQEAMATQT